jgi:hypothetical protein
MYARGNPALFAHSRHDLVDARKRRRCKRGWITFRPTDMLGEYARWVNELREGVLAGVFTDKQVRDAIGSFVDEVHHGIAGEPGVKLVEKATAAVSSLMENLLVCKLHKTERPDSDRSREFKHTGTRERERARA